MRELDKDDQRLKKTYAEAWMGVDILCEAIGKINPVDSDGQTLDFLLRSKRDSSAATAFFRKTLGAVRLKR